LSPGEHALALAAFGLPIFPIHGVADGRCACGRRVCKNAGKHPRSKHGHNDATTNAEQIQMWWLASPNANVGVRTGNGYLVLDIDPRNHGHQMLESLLAKHGPLPVTPTVRTGGGGHHFYLSFKGSLACKTALFRGIDVKADGGYVVAPPSVHFKGGRYSWEPGRSLDEVLIQPAPEWLLTEMQVGRAAAKSNGVPAGGRNNRLMSLAGRLRRDGADEDAIRDALRVENSLVCQPPLDPSEVAAIASSVCRYPVGAESSSVADLLRAAGIDALTEESSTKDREGAIKRLNLGAAKLDPLQRAFLRSELVDRFALPAPVADAVVAKPRGNDAKQQGSSVLFVDPEPWPTPVDGAPLLNEIYRAVTRYVVLPPQSAVAVACWVLHTYTLEAAQITPRLAIVSPEKRCGKSTLLKLLAALVWRPLPAANITAAVLFRAIETLSPTLLVDEADTFLRDRDDVRGVLNAGHDRQIAKVLRCVGDDHEPRVFGVWAAVAFAGIGKQHDTLMDRSIVLSMKRRATSEPVAQFRRRQREELGELQRKCVRWARDSLEQLQSVKVVSPPGLDDRAADNWESLFAIARVAGAMWPERAHAAALGLSGAERAEEGDTHGEQLLSDIRAIFDEGGSRLPAKTVLDRLLAMDERPWSEANRGRPLTAAQLGKRLGRFGIRSHTARTGDSTARSYFRADFEDAFSRYQSRPTATPVTRLELQDKPSGSEASHLRVVTDADIHESLNELSDVTDVTDVDGVEQSYLEAERAAIQKFGS
jgi:putative DNA primase/helicase